MFDKVIYLVSETLKKDSIGQQKKSGTINREVYAETKPIPQSEFFKAGQYKIKPAKCFKIRQYEYKGEQKILFEDVMYEVYRTFDTKNEMIELYCEARSGGK